MSSHQTPPHSPHSPTIVKGTSGGAGGGGGGAESSHPSFSPLLPPALNSAASSPARPAMNGTSTGGSIRLTVDTTNTAAHRTSISHSHGTLPVVLSGSQIGHATGQDVSILVHNVSHSDMLLSLLTAVMPPTPTLVAEAHAGADSPPAGAAGASHRPHITVTSTPPAPTPTVAAMNLSAPLSFAAASAMDSKTNSPLSLAAFPRGTTSAASVASGTASASGSPNASFVPAIVTSATAMAGTDDSVIARPKFHQFKAVGDRLLKESEAYRNAPLPAALFPIKDNQSAPFGYLLPIQNAVEFPDWSYFHLRSETAVERSEKPRVTGVFFPIVGLILPRWNYICDQRAPNSKKVLYLISGAGTPWNKALDAKGNSTHSTAKLLKEFCRQFYPDLVVEILHSGKEIFHYDANVRFVNEKLRPPIEQHRRELAHTFGDQWSKHLHLTLSLSDGAPARISAINASLRQFRPDCLHMWQLKTFWHSYPVMSKTEMDNDLEFHEFEKLEMAPAIPLGELKDSDIKAVVRELILHKHEFERVRDTPNTDNELSSFWLRKSKQPVLSVLLVQKEDPHTRRLISTLYRGINMEVSMPTGSLCSERNAIGTALNHDPGLRRKDLKMVAVLALPLEVKQPATAAAPPTGLDGSRPPSGNILLTAQSSTSSSSGGGQQPHAQSANYSSCSSANHQHSTGTGTGPYRQLWPVNSISTGTGAVPVSVAATTTTRATSAPTEQVNGAASHSSGGGGVSNATVLMAQSSIESTPSSPAHPSGGGGVSRNGLDSGALSRQLSDNTQLSSSSVGASALTRSTGSGVVMTSGGAAGSPVPSAASASSSSSSGAAIQLNTASAVGGSSSSNVQVGSGSLIHSTGSTGGADQKHHPPGVFFARSNSVNALTGGYASTGTATGLGTGSLTSRASSGSTTVRPALQVIKTYKTKPTDSLNPIAPCGACQEWLKKIAEVNPDFKVITFTDTTCEQVFVKSVKD